MADSWQSAWVEVLPDFSNFTKKANSEMSRVLGDAGDAGGFSASKGINGGVLGGIGKLAAPLAVAFAALGIGQIIGDALSAGFDYAVASVDLASNLQQSQGAVQAIFGESAAAVSKFASTSVDDLGLTENAYNELASVLGSQLKNGGTAIDQIAGKTDNLIGLGADLSAQFGGSTQQAVDSLSSALRGERDPIEKYGVSLTQAAVDAKAAELGFAKVGGTLSTQANQAATLAIILDQTASAQGRFAAESDTLAGQQARLKAGFEEAQTALGTALLPALTELATFANTTLVPLLDDLIAQVGPVLGQALTDSAPAFKELVLAIAPLIPDLVKLGVELLPVFIELLILAAPLLLDLAESMASGAANLNALLAVFQGTGSIDQFIASVQGSTGSLVELQAGFVSMIYDIGQNLAAFVTTVSAGITDAVGFVSALPAEAVAALAGIGTLLVSSGADFIQGFIDGINSAVGGVGDAIGGVLDFAAGFFPHSPAKRGPFSGAGWTAVKGAGLAIGDQFSAGLNASRSPIDMGSLVSVPSISAGRLPAAGVGAAVSAASGPLVVQNYNGVPNQSLAELRDISANERNEALRELV